VRALILFKEAESLKEKLLLLDAAGAASVRLRKLVLLRHESQEAAKKAAWDEAVDQAIEEVLREEWPKCVSEARSMGLSCLAGKQCFYKGAFTGSP